MRRIAAVPLSMCVCVCACLSCSMPAFIDITVHLSASGPFLHGLRVEGHGVTDTPVKVRLEAQVLLQRPHGLRVPPRRRANVRALPASASTSSIHVAWVSKSMGGPGNIGRSKLLVDTLGNKAAMLLSTASRPIPVFNALNVSLTHA